MQGTPFPVKQRNIKILLKIWTGNYSTDYEWLLLVSC